MPSTPPDASVTPDRPSRKRPGRTTRQRSGRKPEKIKPTFKENVSFWIKAIVVILFLRAFIFEPYRIPSESMEDTLLVGDFLIVSKLHYGARTPNTIGIPFTRIYVPGLVFPQTRLPGFSEPARGDVAVFNYPAAVDVERGVIPADTPIERRAPYIKRIVAVPGDTLAMVDKMLILNGSPVPLGATLKQRWRAFSADGDRPTAREMLDMNVQYLEGTDGQAADGVRQFDITTTPGGAQLLAADPEVARVEPFVLPDSISFSDPRLFDPRAIDLIYDPALAWNADQYGPLVVPGVGMTIDVTAETMETYADVLEQYEGVEVAEARGGGYLLNGVARDTYTFKADYYFAMGDNRDNSVDSRYWGFVPKTHLVGKAVFKFLSFKGEFPFVRPSRFFRPIR
ncbi:signal peptidase I [Rubricoccus marinus]|uniref:Signal peptidase I n=1 Tax=Rubricoccus marinus TaxID=716817 RepID=A0A259TYJ1_9BACT|nr:signal peptidase I [Rubricoccus marinus]OZC02843.1 signal peptidase I [Rubricoccus marinus]